VGAHRPCRAAGDGALSRLRDGWRRIPRAGRACALIALVNGIVWALLIPPYHVPDEPVHVAYTQYLAETGKLPTHDPGPEYSTEQQVQLAALDFYAVTGNRGDKPPWSSLQQERLEDATDGKRRDDGGHKSVASNNPPLYYMAEAVAYRLTPGASLMTRLYAMRLVSALMAALTVLFVFLFVRELLPGTPWTWTVGALAVAFQPMFGFESGGVNNDNLLYLCSAALFFALARAFRRGLTVRRGAFIGLALGAGVLTKFTMAAFAPAVGLALLVLIWRAAPADRRAAFRAAGVVVGLGSALLLIYVAANSVIWGRPLLQDAAGVSTPSPGAGRAGGLREQLSYYWQLFLPRLPFMQDHFPHAVPLWDTWFTGFNGRFGWLDYDFGRPFYRWIGWLVYLPLLVLAGVGLYRSRAALGRRLLELAVYALAVLGLVVAIARPSYTTFLSGAAFPFFQPRYILPLLPLFAAIVALAVRGAGRRAAPYVGTGIVMLALAHTLFAQLLTITRYYA